jgi:hypothetical protein
METASTKLAQVTAEQNNNVKGLVMGTFGLNNG